MIEHKGCAITAFDSGLADVLMHQVNCQGAMNSGIAKSIRSEYNEHYKDYMDYCEFHDNPSAILGTYVQTNIEFGTIVGLFGQLKYGYGGEKYTNHVALIKAMTDFTKQYRHMDEKPIIAIPKFMGCDRGGGSWELMEVLIQELEELNGITIHCYKL